MTITHEQLMDVGQYTVAVEHGWQHGIEKYGPTVDAILNFSSRESYFVWTELWNEQYQQLSKDIRQLKRSRKMSSPTYNPEAAGLVRLYGWHATLLLYLRREAKARSWQMKLARLATEKAKA